MTFQQDRYLENQTKAKPLLHFQLLGLTGTLRSTISPQGSNNFLRCFSLTSNTRFRMINLFFLPYLFLSTGLFDFSGTTFYQFLTTGSYYLFIDPLILSDWSFLTCLPINNTKILIIIIFKMIQIKGAKGTIDIQRAFGCLHCEKVAFQPFIYSCCQVIICQRCVQNGFPCPKCNKYGSIKLSLMLQQIYRFVAFTCPYGCLAELPLSQVHKHMQTCPQGTAECIYCKQTPKIKQLHFHLAQKHQQQCNRLLNYFQKNPQQENKIFQASAGSIKKIQPFKVGTTGTMNIQPRLGLNGRITCGKQLPKHNSGSLFMNSSSSFFGKNDQVCSIQHGSCERCMELDINRLGLPKHHFLNLQGRICKYYPEKQSVHCGCGSESKACTDRFQCRPCSQLYELIKRGLYDRLLQ